MSRTRERLVPLAEAATEIMLMSAIIGAAAYAE